MKVNIPKGNVLCGKCKNFWVRDGNQRDCPYCEIDRLRDKHEVEIESLKEALSDLSKRVYWLEVKNKSCR